MIEVVIQVEAGSRDKRLYDEKTLEYKGTRQASLPYPYPYGFIIGTSSEDGDNIDCYVITEKTLKAGAIVECEPIGLLEQEEGDEFDHNILAAIPGQDVVLDEALLEELRTFISGIFARFPDLTVKVGRILPKEAALRYLQKGFLET